MKKFSYGYILSLASAVLILLQVIGIKVDVPYVNEIITAILGVLVALGIVGGNKNVGGGGEQIVKEEIDDCLMQGDAEGEKDGAVQEILKD